MMNAKPLYPAPK